jgi:predicted nucleic acid-binding protein
VRVWRLSASGGLSLSESRPIREFTDVASRPELIRKLRLTETGTAQFITELVALAEMIDPIASFFVHPIDPKDTMIVNLAVAAGAHVITSRDHHLLSLRDTSNPVGMEFMARFPSIEVLTPVQLLQRVRAV